MIKKTILLLTILPAINIFGAAAPEDADADADAKFKPNTNSTAPESKPVIPFPENKSKFLRSPRCAREDDTPPVSARSETTRQSNSGIGISIDDFMNYTLKTSTERITVRNWINTNIRSRLSNKKIPDFNTYLDAIKDFDNRIAVLKYQRLFCELTLDQFMRTLKTEDQQLAVLGWINANIKNPKNLDKPHPDINTYLETISCKKRKAAVLEYHRVFCEE